MAAPHSILFTIPNFITAGSGRALLNLVERLDRTRFAPGVCVARKGGDLDQEVEAMGIPFYEAPFTVSPKPYVTLPWRAWRASRAVAHAQASVVSGQSSVVRDRRSVSPSSCRSFALWHSFHYSDDYTEPIIARMAGAQAWVFTKKNMGWGSRAWSLRSRFATRIAAQNGDMMRDFFPANGLSSKARLVPRGVDCSKFSPDIPPTLRIRAQSNIPVDSTVVACVAHLVPVKGHPTLLKALADLPELHLLLAGKPLDRDYAGSLHEQVAQLDLGDRVHFLGRVQEVPAMLAESDIFVLPTWAKWRMEGCPVALLEAMACGKACVATDIPGSRDLLEHGRSGWLVAPEDPKALAGALRQLVASPALCQQLGNAARQRVLGHFTLEREVAAHESLYEELLRQ
jgi:glycosyltransferase involved in cell wall biosynthesis